MYQQLKELLAQRDLALYQQLKELLAQRDLSTAALAIGGSIAGSSARQPEADPVEVELEQVEAQVDALGLKFAVASDKEQDALLIEIGALQDQRFRLCGQLSTDSAAKDLYC